MFTAYAYNGTGTNINYRTTGKIPQILARTTGAETPSVSFTATGGSVDEGVGAYNLTVNISSTANLTADAVINVALKSGDSKIVNGFASQAVTFTKGGAASQAIKLSIVDDTLLQGTRALVFNLAVASGNVTIGAPNEFTLSVLDNEGSFGGAETFANFPETGSSYLNGTFKGQDGSVWSYVYCSEQFVRRNK